MPIRFEGSKFQTGVLGATSQVDLTSGFAGQEPEPGDYVVAAYALGSGAPEAAGATITDSFGVAYPTITKIHQLNSAANRSITFLVAGKFHVAGDNFLTIGAASAQSGAAFSTYVFSGVDPLNPLDVPFVGLSTPDTVIVDPPPITPVTPGAWPVVFGGGVQQVTAQGYTSPTLEDFDFLFSSANLDCVIGAGYISDWVSGPYDDGAWTLDNPDASTAASAVVCLALRPTAPVGGKFKVWNGSAWVEKPAKVWNGSAWVEKPVKVWNGSSWVLA